MNSAFFQRILLISTLSLSTLAFGTELDDVAEKAGEGKVILFDLDDTLFSTQNRNFKILSEFLADPRNCVEIKALCDHLNKNMGIRHIEWDSKNTLRNVGFNEEQVTAFMAKYQPFWGPKFFSNDYLKNDKPIQGAQKYVKEVFEKGATIVYLTGRNQEKMLEGTQKALRKYKFPLDNPRVHLFLKPGNAEDTEFKKSVFEKIEGMGELIAALDNEPQNIIAMAEHEGFAGATFFFLDTAHSGRVFDTLASRTDLVWIPDFTDRTPTSP